MAVLMLPPRLPRVLSRTPPAQHQLQALVLQPSSAATASRVASSRPPASTSAATARCPTVAADNRTAPTWSRTAGGPLLLSARRPALGLHLEAGAELAERRVQVGGVALGQEPERAGLFLADGHDRAAVVLGVEVIGPLDAGLPERQAAPPAHRLRGAQLDHG